MPDLFRLSDDDFKNIGCTNAELEEVKKCNDALNKLGQPSLDDDIKKKQNLQEQLYTIFLKAADRNPAAWEYRASRLPEWMKSTGNVATVDQFMRAYGDRLSLADKTRLLKRRMATMKARVNDIMSKNEAEPKENSVDTVKVISNSEKDAMLEGIHQPQYQNSGNGCWSVSTQMLLQSRGIKNVSQTDIRSFRPGYTGHDIRKRLQSNEDPDTIKAIEAESIKMMETDSGNNTMERGDAFLAFSPGSMLKGIQISPYSNEIRMMGIDKKEYLKRTTETVRKNILHAIKEDKSPISFLRGGHYITIIGIDANNNVKYKESLKRADSEGPDQTHTVKLDKLLGRVISDRPSPIRMEWASEIKLSKDGTRLYNIPNGNLTVGEDGKVILPTTPSTLDNVLNGFQNKTGIYVRRRNYSESPDEMGNRENSLANGGVDISEIIYLPKELNMDLLKKKANNRTDEEEKRLQDISKKFYNIDYGKNQPGKSQEEMDAVYNEAEREQSVSESNKQKEKLSQMKAAVEAAILQPAPTLVVKGQSYRRYINGLATDDKIKNMATFNLKKVFSKAVIASKLQSEGRKFNEKVINDQAEKLLSNTSLREVEKKDVDFMIKVLTSPNREDALRKVQGVVTAEIYGVEEKYRNSYFKEMKLLAKNMMSKKKRSKEYQNLYDAVMEAASIRPDDPEVQKKITEANQKIVDTADKYMAGKEKIRSSTDGKDRFDNAVDAISIVSTFAPGANQMGINSIVSRINKIREAAKPDKPSRVDLKNFGGNRAENRNMERVEMMTVKK